MATRKRYNRSPTGAADVLPRQILSWPFVAADGQIAGNQFRKRTFR